MSFSKIIYGLLMLRFGLAGLAFGALFVLCLSLYLLWHGLSVSVVAFGVLCFGSTVLAHLGLHRARTQARAKLPTREPALFNEARVPPRIPAQTRRRAD